MLNAGRRRRPVLFLAKDGLYYWCIYVLLEQGRQVARPPGQLAHSLPRPAVSHKTRVRSFSELAAALHHRLARTSPVGLPSVEIGRSVTLINLGNGITNKSSPWTMDADAAGSS